MPKAKKFPPAHDSAMKALIVYDDLAIAVRANVALRHSARNADFAVRWKVNPWQIDMLKFSPTTEEALMDALDAHLVVIARSSAKSSTFWFRGWVELWAERHQIQGAALALLGYGSSDGLPAPVIDEFSSLAQRHELSLIFDEGPRGKNQSNFIQQSLGGQKLLASKPVMPIPDEQVRHPYSHWGINE